MMAGEVDPQVVFNCLLSVCTYSNSDEEDRSIFRGLPLVLSLLFKSCTCHRQLFELIVGHVQHVEDDQPRVAMRLLEFCTLWSQHGMKEEVTGQKKKKKNLPTLTEGEEEGDNDHEDGFCKLRDDMRSFAEGRAPSQQKKNLLKALSSFSSSSSSSSTSRGGAVLQRSSGKLFFLSSSARSSFSLFVRPFQWLMWDAEDIACTLAHMTWAPLEQLKSWHFFEQEKGGRGGENNSKCSTLASISNYSSSSSSPLSQLSSLCNALSDFCTFSILQSAHCFGQEYCTILTSHWIQIAVALRTLRCYHLLHALQMAWQRHACDSQRWLWQSIAISNPHLAQQKSSLDQWFDPVARFAPLIAEQEKCIRQQEPFVPCIFLLQQRSILLQESPLVIFVEDEEGKKTGVAHLNLHRIGATGKMFRELIASQEKKLVELTPAAKHDDDDAMVSYFGVLNSFKMDEDDVYKRGDALRDKFTPQKYDLKKKVPKELIECRV